MLKKRVLSTNGDDLGPVKDVDFDPASGAVTALILDAGEVAGKRMVGIGSYADRRPGRVAAIVVQANRPRPSYRRNSRVPLRYGLT